MSPGNGRARRSPNARLNQQVSSHTSAQTRSHSDTELRQGADDTLFGAAMGAYGDAHWGLPDEELTGSERKERGQRKAACNMDSGWRSKAVAAVEQCARRGAAFTSDEVRRLVDDDAIS